MYEPFFSVPISAQTEDAPGSDWKENPGSDPEKLPVAVVWRKKSPTKNFRLSGSFDPREKWCADPVAVHWTVKLSVAVFPSGLTARSSVGMWTVQKRPDGATPGLRSWTLCPEPGSKRSSHMKTNVRLWTCPSSPT